MPRQAIHRRLLDLLLLEVRGSGVAVHRSGLAVHRSPQEIDTRRDPPTLKHLLFEHCCGKGSSILAGDRQLAPSKAKMSGGSTC
mmetsp:Transcript_50389/g.163061  ORF Transcript_50389/g.163061 Transcript_50389/m.163061 type:complete len:84 (+) Transcript_50389:256-507(+)